MPVKTGERFLQLQDAIAAILSGPGFYVKKLEACCKLSLAAWSELKKEVVSYRFASMDEEIDFFKRVKPRFVAELEYYNFLYHAELIRPSQTVSELPAFWFKETRRLQDFIRQNAEFYFYYKSGDSSMDSTWFVRRKAAIPSYHEPKYFDSGGPMASSTHDHRVASIIAIEKYNVHALAQPEATARGKTVKL